MEAVEYMWPILKGSRPPQGICGKAAPACSVCSPLCILTAHAGCSALALPGSGRLLELFKQAIKLHRQITHSKWGICCGGDSYPTCSFHERKVLVLLNWGLSCKGTMQELSACQAEWRSWIKIGFFQPWTRQTHGWIKPQVCEHIY